MFFGFERLGDGGGERGEGEIRHVERISFDFGLVRVCYRGLYWAEGTFQA